MNFTVIALILIVLLIVVFTTCAGCYVVPYEENNIFTAIQYPYEGFNARPKNNCEPFSATRSMIDSAISKITGVEKDAKKDAKKVEGFGLMPAPYGVEAPIDRFSALKSEKTCTSSPYSTSTGYLCMDKETERLLKTRGGNISGGDSQIGSQ